MTQRHQTTVTLTGGPKVNLAFDPDRISHHKARDALEALQDTHDMTQRQAVEWALTGLHDAPAGEALEHLSATWGLSDAATVREALRRYATEVQTQ